MSNKSKPLRFVYGRWRINTPEVESCVNILKVEDGKQGVKMSSMVYRKSNRASTYQKSRGVSNVWKWVVWKEKMTTWTFHVLKAWNGRKSIVRKLSILKWTFFLTKALNRGIECWRIDTIRTGRHDSSSVKSIRLTGSRFAKEDNTYLSVKLGYSFDSRKSATPFCNHLRNIF